MLRLLFDFLFLSLITLLCFDTSRPMLIPSLYAMHKPISVLSCFLPSSLSEGRTVIMHVLPVGECAARIKTIENNPANITAVPATYGCRID